MRLRRGQSAGFEAANIASFPLSMRRSMSERVELQIAQELIAFGEANGRRQFSTSPGGITSITMHFSYLGVGLRV